MQYLEPPTTTSKLQLNYRIVIIQNCLKSNWADVLQLSIKRRSHIETGRRYGNVQRAGSTPHVVIKIQEGEGSSVC